MDSGTFSLSACIGDNVWIFRGDGLIQQVKITQIDEVSIWCKEPNNLVPILLNKDYPIFPTREALCEHYRKIFE